MLMTNEKWQKSQLIGSIFKIISIKAFLTIRQKLLNCTVHVDEWYFCHEGFNTAFGFGQPKCSLTGLNLSLIRPVKA